MKAETVNELATLPSSEPGFAARLLSVGERKVTPSRQDAMPSPDYIPEIPSSIPYATIGRRYLQQAEKESYHVAREHAIRTRWHNPRQWMVLVQFRGGTIGIVVTFFLKISFRCPHAVIGVSYYYAFIDLGSNPRGFFSPSSLYVLHFSLG